MKIRESEVVDIVLDNLEDLLKAEGRHLLKTDTIFDHCSAYIDLTDTLPERERLLERGMRQTMQTRLYARHYFSVATGYFVNVDTCDNLGYLNLIINGKDDVIEGKIAARNRIKELKELDGQMVFVPDENGVLTPIETKTHDELIEDLEADAI
ncbi:MAG: hypothetical protein J6I53_10985 [Treponema sp.]|nr:hypothetical protein [Treponema sp.]